MRNVVDIQSRAREVRVLKTLDRTGDVLPFGESRLPFPDDPDAVPSLMVAVVEANSPPLGGDGFDYYEHCRMYRDQENGRDTVLEVHVPGLVRGTFHVLANTLKLRRLSEYTMLFMALGIRVTSSSE